MVTGNQTHIALMGYKLPPLIGLQYRYDTPEDETRDYKDIELEPAELVADSRDELVFYLFISSLTADDKTEANPEYTPKNVKITLDQASSPLFEVIEDTKYSEPGEKKYSIRAKKETLFERGVPTTVKIAIEAKIATTKDDKIIPRLDGKIEVPVTPCYLYAKLWVIPGAKRHTSQAGAMVTVRLPRDPWVAPLPDLEAELMVEPPTGVPSLTVSDSNVKNVRKNGTVEWVLTYAGLTFDNIGEAEFDIKFRLGDMEKALTMHISVGRNVLDYLSDIERSAAALDLTNMEFQHDSSTTSGRIFGILDYLWPDSTLGVLYNARNFLAGVVGYPKPESWSHYTCGELARRLLYWSMERRFGYGRYNCDTAQKMNGIELGEYTFFRLHDFFGFNLSSNDPWKEAKMIDPWWNQAYDNQVVLSLTEECVKLPAALTWLILTGGLFIKFLGPSFISFCSSSASAINVAVPGAKSAFVTISYLLGYVRAWIMVAIKGSTFDPKITVGVFGTVAAIATALFWPALFAEIGMFDDDTLMTYSKYRTKWVTEQQEALISAHPNGLPPMDKLVQW